MNIHIDDREIFEELKKQSIFNIEIGSRMYGTNNYKSDTDILYIYIPSYDELNSIGVHHHQIQYKENDVDHIFTDIYTFLKNALSGDSTINFEVINSTKLKGTKLSWLYEYRHKFRNYKILRAYLGRARKDLKQMKSKSTVEDMTKKVSHAIRCYTFACNILEDDFRTEWDDEFHYNILESTRNMTNKRKIYERAKEYEMKISVLRERVNCLLDEQKLGMEQYASTSSLRFIDLMVRAMVIDFRENNKKSNYFATLSNYVYDAVANGIEYENSNVKVK